ncbi:MAG: DHH family phosphoesterase, partial [archaeon]
MKGLKEVADFVRENDGFVVVSHYDADGLAAAGIAGLMLKRLGKKYKYLPTKSLDSQRIRDIAKHGDVFLFVDLGSGSVSAIEEGLAGKKYAITDHHPPQKQGEAPHFNPCFSGYDGSFEVSGSGAVYLVAREIDERNKDLAKIAVVGAVGDMQDQHGKLVGLNRKILQDGIDAGELETRVDIRLFGRHSRPLTQFLVYCTDPFLPGLTANEEGSHAFITSLGIPLKDGDKWRYYCDLNEDEKKRFVSAVYVHAKQSGAPEFILRSLVGEVYELKCEPHRSELRDAKEFSTVLNACGRNDEGVVGIMVCEGDRHAYWKKARALLQKHRQSLCDGIRLIQENGAEEMGSIYVIDGGKEIKDTIIGTVAGMLYGSGDIKQDKPVIGLSVDEDGMLKVSGRATRNLVRRGLHLGEA